MASIGLKGVEEFGGGGGDKPRKQKSRTIMSVNSKGSFVETSGRTSSAGDSCHSVDRAPAVPDPALTPTATATASAAATATAIATAVYDSTDRGDSCSQLKNIQYKSMLMNGKNLAMLSEGGTSPLVPKTTEIDMVHSLLTSELRTPKENQPWNRLSKAQKIKLLTDYSYMYSSEYSLTDVETVNLQKYLRECLERKKFTRAKDIHYNRSAGVIEDIPGLVTTTSAAALAAESAPLLAPQVAPASVRKFTLKREDTVKNSTLKNLAPKKGKQVEPPI